MSNEITILDDRILNLEEKILDSNLILEDINNINFRTTELLIQISEDIRKINDIYGF